MASIADVQFAPIVAPGTSVGLSLWFKYGISIQSLVIPLPIEIYDAIRDTDVILLPNNTH